ncbi:phytoene/squalene synthase family protein [Variovorax sp. GT1P44]|uniref:phytoene/squalene synthase family protein n=1 Tax=Variovorax sp. GT1P44 TaxID=3443742 RepID=UPI003F47554E
MAACRDALRQGSRTFLAASLMLPREVRDAACALYAFCRMADDAVDCGHGASAAVAMLRGRLACAYDGTPDAAAPSMPVDRALAAVAARFDIPRALPEALLEGFAWDAECRHYDSFEELCDYAARVAGSVGAMMALLMGVRSADVVARACDLGVAMQLSNIARDVGEDAALGRLYLPRDWMREAGLDPDAWLAQAVHTPALGSVVARLLRAADVLYRRVGAGVAQLPVTCRPGINAARFLYADIGRAVRLSGFDGVGRRAVVPPMRKAWSLLRAGLVLWPRGASQRWPVLPSNAFLVEAVVAAAGTESAPVGRGPAERLLWALELLERLDRRQALEPLHPAARA